MLFGQVLQPVVIEIAAQPHGGQHENLPVRQPLPAPVASRRTIDIRSNQREDPVSQFRLRIDVPKCGKNRNDFIPAVQIQINAVDRLPTKLLLPVKRLSHPCHSSKMTAWYSVSYTKYDARAQNSSLL